MSPCGPESGVFSGNSLNAPVLGSSRPSLFAICPVYQSAPSGATAGSCGLDFGVGTSYSRMETLKSPAGQNAQQISTAATAANFLAIGTRLRRGLAPNIKATAAIHWRQR